MKKALISILALLLTAAMLTGFAACGKKAAETPTTATAETKTAAESVAGEAGHEPTTEEATTYAGETGTADADATTDAQAANAVPEEGVLNPVGMAKAELVEWYNDRINYMREKKPAFTRVETLKIERIDTSMGRLADGIINPIMNMFMPGDPTTDHCPKGTGNAGIAFSKYDKSVVRASDPASVSAKKEGGNYVITLTLGSETNPAPDGSSIYSRFFTVMTRQDLLHELEGFLEADPNKATMVYHSGKVVLTVNQKGEIIGTSMGCKIDVEAREVKAGPIKADTLSVKQSCAHEYSNFTY